MCVYTHFGLTGIGLAVGAGESLVAKAAAVLENLIVSAESMATASHTIHQIAG